MKRILMILFLLNGVVFFADAQNFRLWATYYGGSDNEFGNSVTTDASGNVYVAGWTNSLNAISSPGSYQPFSGGSTDAFLVKFNGAGVRLWATYYGGSSDDQGYDVATDASGNIYLAGYTSSTNGIATPGTQQSSISGGSDAFLVKFDANGNRIWGTYFGGPDFDQGISVATDAAGNVYLAGATLSTSGISTAGAHQVTNGGYSDGFLVKFNGSNGTRIWGTYYGGSDQDQANAVATDASGNVVICGVASSTDSIASGGFQNSFNGYGDAFVAKFTSSGTRLWATYYGGSNSTDGNGIATGTGGTIYLAGRTFSDSAIATPGAHQTTFGGFADAYLVKFDAAGNRLWGTYYGGYKLEEGTEVATDAFGNVFLTGDTYGSNGGDTIATPGGYQNSLLGPPGIPGFPGPENEFLAAFNTNGVRVSATYYGSLHEEEGRVAVNVFGDVFLAGTAKSTTGIASPSGYDTTFGGGIWDAYLVKFATAAPHQEVIVPNNNLPPNPSNPPPKLYASVDIFNGGGISITNAVLRNFSSGTPLPASGSETINFSCEFSAIYSDGGPSVSVTCPAMVKMKVDFSSASGPTLIYTTELLQLDLSGGTLPPGVQLRESPTLSSAGQLLITDIGGGHFRMSSFFDVFTELSLDAGNSWQSGSNSPARLELQDEPTVSIPTLSGFALISLAVLFLFIGLFLLKPKVA